MAATYDLIATATPSGVSSFTFSSIPGTYTDLVIHASAINGSNSNYNVFIRPNGDTSSSYDRMVFYGPSVGGVKVGTNNAGLYIGDASASGSGTYDSATMYINNYTNTSIQKTSVSKNGQSGYAVAITSSVWINQSAITSLDFYVSGGTFGSGTRFSLFGIKAA